MSDRIIIVKDGKVVPGQEDRWKRYLQEEIVKLKAITEKMSTDPTFDEEDRRMLALQLALSDTEWEKIAKQGAISASYRLGVGSISIVSDD